MHVPKECYGARDMYEYPSKDIYASLRNPPFALPRRVLTFLTVIVPFTIFWTLLSYDRLPSFYSLGPARTPSISHWQGWANVENMFVLYVPKRRQVEKRKQKLIHGHQRRLLHQHRLRPQKGTTYPQQPIRQPSPPKILIP